MAGASHSGIRLSHPVTRSAALDRRFKFEPADSRIVSEVQVTTSMWLLRSEVPVRAASLGAAGGARGTPGSAALRYLCVWGSGCMHNSSGDARLGARLGALWQLVSLELIRLLPMRRAFSFRSPFSLSLHIGSGMFAIWHIR